MYVESLDSYRKYSSLLDVQQNITTISKQLRSEENDLQHLFDELEDDDAASHSGLPLTEILEELDEEGNVICESKALDVYLTRLTTLQRAKYRDQRRLPRR